MLDKTKQFLNFFSLNEQEKKVFIYIFIISLVCLFSLLQANILYLDDFIRVIEGDVGWNGNARPMATIISVLLQWAMPLTDISPLPQIICFVLYCLGFIYLSRIFKINSFLLLVLSGVIFLINPYNLSIYSFIFDSFPMGLGVFFSIIAFYLTKRGIDNFQSEYHNKKYLFSSFLVSIILLTTSLSLYQPTLSFYLISFTFYLLTELCRNSNYQKSVINFLIFLSILFLSFLSYIPIKNNSDLGKYTLYHSQLPKLSEIPETIVNNVIESWNKINWDLGNGMMAFLLKFLFFLIGITIIFLIVKNNRQKKQNLVNLIINLLLGICYYLILITSFIFPSLILANPVWHTRIFTGFTAVVGIGCLFLAHFYSIVRVKFLRYFLIFYFSLIVLSFTNVTLTYGNVIHHQHEYEQRIGTLLMADLEEASLISSISLDKPKIVFANLDDTTTLKRNILNLKALEKYPILSSLAYSYFNTDGFGIIKLKSFGIDLEKVSKQELIPSNQEYYIPTNKPIITRQLYNIYTEKDDIFVIIFK